MKKINLAILTLAALLAIWGCRSKPSPFEAEPLEGGSIRLVTDVNGSRPTLYQVNANETLTHIPLADSIRTPHTLQNIPLGNYLIYYDAAGYKEGVTEVSVNQSDVANGFVRMEQTPAQPGAPIIRGFSFPSGMRVTISLIRADGSLVLVKTGLTTPFSESVDDAGDFEVKFEGAGLHDVYASTHVERGGIGLVTARPRTVASNTGTIRLNATVVSRPTLYQVNANETLTHIPLADSIRTPHTLQNIPLGNYLIYYDAAGYKEGVTEVSVNQSDVANGFVRMEQTPAQPGAPIIRGFSFPSGMRVTISLIRADGSLVLVKTGLTTPFSESVDDAGDFEVKFEGAGLHDVYASTHVERGGIGLVTARPRTVASNTGTIRLNATVVSRPTLYQVNANETLTHIPLADSIRTPHTLQNIPLGNYLIYYDAAGYKEGVTEVSVNQSDVANGFVRMEQTPAQPGAPIIRGFSFPSGMRVTISLIRADGSLVLVKTGLTTPFSESVDDAGDFEVKFEGAGLHDVYASTHVERGGIGLVTARPRTVASNTGTIRLNATVVSRPTLYQVNANETLTHIPLADSIRTPHTLQNIPLGNYLIYYDAAGYKEGVTEVSVNQSDVANGFVRMEQTPAQPGAPILRGYSFPTGMTAFVSRINANGSLTSVDTATTPFSIHLPSDGDFDVKFEGTGLSTVFDSDHVDRGGIGLVVAHPRTSPAVRSVTYDFSNFYVTGDSDRATRVLPNLPAGKKYIRCETDWRYMKQQRDPLVGLHVGTFAVTQPDPYPSRLGTFDASVTYVMSYILGGNEDAEITYQSPPQNNVINRVFLRRIKLYYLE